MLIEEKILPPEAKTSEISCAKTVDIVKWRLWVSAFNFTAMVGWHLCFALRFMKKEQRERHENWKPFIILSTRSSEFWLIFTESCEYSQSLTLGVNLSLSLYLLGIGIAISKFCDYTTYHFLYIV